MTNSSVGLFGQRNDHPGLTLPSSPAARLRQVMLLAGSGLFLAATGGPAFAQDSAAQAEQRRSEGEIIVTARKREESILEVPVIQTVLTAEAIDRRSISDLNDIAQFAPGLVMGQAALSSGSIASIRGFGTFALNPGVDQSVSLVIDGLPMTHGLAYQSGYFDLAQVEVLKGPQSLFFGKSAPAGVISLRTADPGSRLEVIGRALYEVEARERRGELILSTPIGETAGFRLATALWKSDGFFENKAIPLAGTGGQIPESRLGGSKGYQLRGTLTLKPSPSFDARLKLNYSHDNHDNAGAFQMASCPEGTAPSGAALRTIHPDDDCKMDRTIYLVDFDPRAFPATDLREGGHQYNLQKQFYGTLEMNYRPTDALTLTSVTGYFNFKSSLMFNTNQTGYAAGTFASNSDYDRDEFTQELRLNSDFAGPFNFTLGGFYQHAKAYVVTITAANQVTTTQPANLGGTIHTLKIKSLSAFGQLRYRPSEQFELAAGGRYTSERRENIVVNPLTLVPFVIPRPKLSSDKFAPEVTLSYFPNENNTLFLSYKKGYKSGSYGLGRLPSVSGVIIDNSFGDEDVEGGEGGWKGRLAGGQLSAELGGYYYKFKGLQLAVSQAIALAGGGLPFTRVFNAGGARIYGAELSLDYRPASVDGLDLHADIAWNNSKFTDLQGVPCYGGQTIALGCNQLPRNPAVPTTNFSAQENLAGLPLPRAPEWVANFGLSYEIPMANGMRLTLSNDNHFASRQMLNIGRRDDFFQRSFFKFDLAAILKGADDKWELAVIGKNLGNRITSGFCSSSNYANSTAANQPTGTSSNLPNGVDEVGCTGDRGRSIIFRLTVRPFGK